MLARTSPQLGFLFKGKKQTLLVVPVTHRSEASCLRHPKQGTISVLEGAEFSELPPPTYFGGDVYSPVMDSEEKLRTGKNSLVLPFCAYTHSEIWGYRAKDSCRRGYS